MAGKRKGKKTTSKKDKAVTTRKNAETLPGESVRVKKDPNVAFRTIEGKEVVIVPLTRKLQMLNEVGTRIWNLCNGRRTIGEIADIIVNEYDVDRKTALNDLKEFVRRMHKEKMVQLK